MNFETLFHKSSDARILAERVSDACSAGDEGLVQQYVAELDTKCNEIVTEVEMDLPRFAVDSGEPDERETVARGLLDQYHELTVKLRIQQAIFDRIQVRYPLSDMAQAALAKRNDTHTEREALIWTILELMGVDSAPE